jgi:hypothetical protein
MMDYVSQVAALRVFETELDGLISSGKVPAVQGNVFKDALAKNPSYATLGALIYQLFEHSSSSETEIALLTEASQIWKDIGDFIKQVEDARKSIESLTLDPNQPASASKYATLIGEMRNVWPTQFTSLSSRLQTFYSKATTLNFLPEHGQQQDAPITAWNWRDVIMSRRTGTFISKLSEACKKDGSYPALAFSSGALSSYAANVVGSAFQNSVVGGPRRSHRFRNRLARYSVAAWLQQNFPGISPTIPDIRAAVTFGSPSSPFMPKTVKEILTVAMNGAYGGFGLSAFPDFSKAYLKMLDHLDLLSSFRPLPVPFPINDTVQQSITNDNASVVFDDPINPQQEDKGNDFNWKDWRVWVAIAVCLLIAVIVAAIAGGTAKKNVTVSGTTVTIGSNPPSPLTYQVATQVMFNLHCQLYDFANACLLSLKMLGMIYPEESDLGQPYFSQFFKVPQYPKNFVYPKRSIANQFGFMTLPNSSTENPPTVSSPFTAGMSPAKFLIGTSPNDPNSLASIAPSIWLDQMIGGKFKIHDISVRSSNLNLDADRGYKMECWQIKPGTSISNDPVLAVNLGYNAV